MHGWLKLFDYNFKTVEDNSNLDAGNVENYRPISNLTYISKLVERMVNQQLVAYLDENKLLPKLQSGFRARHSTETALLKVLSDIFLSVDQQQVTLLDMSAEFDTVDHAILLQKTGVFLRSVWWRSVLAVVIPRWPYPAGSSTRVTSSVEIVRSGVPQGSMFIEPTITWVLSGFSGYLWLDAKIV